MDDSPLPEHLKNEPLRDARYRVTDLHSRVTAQGSCALDIALFTESVSAADTHMQHLFPVNALRNRAMLLVRTDLVLVMDGDLLSQNAARAKLTANAARNAALVAAAERKVFHVLPSFDTKLTELAYQTAAGDKAAAVRLFEAGDIVRFGAKGSRFPQGCTDYDRWKLAAEEYAVTYCNRYEPWGVVSRKHSPWFDSRFRGYGRNKIMYAEALNSSGFSFVIDPDTFIIHRPHPRSKAQRIYDNPDDKKVREFIMGMWEQQKAIDRFVPAVDATSLRCKAQLPWWDGIGSAVTDGDGSGGSGPAASSSSSGGTTAVGSQAAVDTMAAGQAAADSAAGGGIPNGDGTDPAAVAAMQNAAAAAAQQAADDGSATKNGVDLPAAGGGAAVT